MVKIDFSNLPCFVDIRKKGKIELDVKFDFSNAMYMRGSGVAIGALAMKIYNSNGEEEYNEQECMIIHEFAKTINPMLADSIQEIINKED